MRIAIVGSGRLAKALLYDLPEIDTGIKTEPWNISSKADVVIHAGSGNQFKEVIFFCEARKTPLIQASTPKELEPPKKLSFVYVKAPNLSLPIVKFTYLLKQIRTLFPQAEKALVESHQATKKTFAGTAQCIADSSGMEASSIQSIRDVTVQKDLGIPEEHLESHALHVLSVEEDDATLTFSTNVYGTRTYSIGAAKIARSCLLLEPGVFEVIDLIEKGALLGINTLA